MNDVISKSAFAKRCSVDPSAVTYWIKNGILTGEALVGEGRMAKINGAVAQAQLRKNRDVGQALGNGIATRIEDTPIASPELPTGNSVEEQIKRVRLDREHISLRRAAVDEAAEPTMEAASS